LRHPMTSPALEFRPQVATNKADKPFNASSSGEVRLLLAS